MAAATPTVKCTGCDAQIPVQQNQDGTELFCYECTEERKIDERIYFFNGCVSLAQKWRFFARFLESQEPGQVAALTEEECSMVQKYLKKNNPKKDECEVCDGTWCDDCTQSDVNIKRSQRWADYKKMCFSLEYLENKGMISSAQIDRLVEATKTSRR
jgi:hypothetical protein